MEPIFYTVRSINGDYADLVADDGREHSIEITVPPMGIAVFTCTPEKVPVKKGRAGKTEKLIKTEKPELSAGEKKVSKTARAEVKKETKAAEKKPAAKNK